jgi:endonuclease VIII
VPEGHTLHRLARSQHAQFAGLPIHVTSPQGRFVDAELVDGRVLDDVRAHGKHLFAAFGDRIVHVHLGLFGKVSAGDGEAPPPRGAVRMRWEASSGWTDLRGPTACAVLSPPEADAILARLGPDPLRPKSDGGRAYARIARSKAPIAGLLMDQAVLAGVGNVYRAEILFRQRIDPSLPGRLLDESRWPPLWSDLVTLMKAGLRSGRIVTTERQDRDRRTGTARRVDAHYVYRRTGLPCRICGTPIEMRELAARKLYWCPVCQAG